MGKLFGTDGIRGIVGSELGIDLALKIGVSTTRVLKNQKDKLTFLVASDTRKSKDVLKFALISGVLSENADIIDLGIIPTSAIAYLIKKYNADGGFVISASHNPSEYNGIKIFNAKGDKVADNIESKIENIILNDFVLAEEVNKFGKYEVAKMAKEDYVDYLKSTVEGDFSKLHIGIDVANGAAFETAEMLFSQLGANYKIINNNPDGLNINDNAGSTHLEVLQKFVVDNHLDCGISFDGDADRCLFVDELGNVVDGDKIIAIYGNYLKNENKLRNNAIVGTVISNLGLKKFCEKNNINYEATKVGDKYVLDCMLENDYIIGGEQSGHIIFREYLNTGDGQLTALQILKVMCKSGNSLSELASVMETYPQVLKNVNVTKEGKRFYKENVNINKCIKNVEQKLNGEGRVLVRASGTENMIRVMVEGKNINVIDSLCDDIVEVIKKELN